MNIYRDLINMHKYTYVSIYYISIIISVYITNNKFLVLHINYSIFFHNKSFNNSFITQLKKIIKLNIYLKNKIHFYLKMSLKKYKRI